MSELHTKADDNCGLPKVPAQPDTRVTSSILRGYSLYDMLNFIRSIHAVRPMTASEIRLAFASAEHKRRHMRSILEKTHQEDDDRFAQLEKYYEETRILVEEN